MEFEFDVGETESHHVRFLTSMANGKVTLIVDGETIRQEKFRFWIPLHRRYEVVVGDSEQHDIAIEVEFARVSRKFTKPTCTAYLDGRVVGVY
jgi:3-hydroxymyristoyl/3-hydroxydecanoyl-(acyl carrier protein) dehydratase